MQSRGVDFHRRRESPLRGGIGVRTVKKGSRAGRGRGRPGGRRALI